MTKPTELTEDQKLTALAVMDAAAADLKANKYAEEFRLPLTVPGVEPKRVTAVLTYLAGFEALEVWDDENAGTLRHRFDEIRRELSEVVLPAPKPVEKKTAKSKKTVVPTRNLVNTYEHENAIHSVAPDMVTFATMVAVNHIMRAQAAKRGQDFREFTMQLAPAYVAKYRPVSASSAKRGLAKAVEVGLLRPVHQRTGIPTTYRAVVPAWWKESR